MRKYYFALTLILVIIIGITSCSDDETKTQNDIASRPIVPIMANEVQIGNQIWMTKNLNVSRYRNGDPIPQVQDPNQWGSLTTGAWCYYNNDSANGKIYGKLYNWYAVNDPRGLAPRGFHVGTEAEWNAAIDFLGGIFLAGGHLKATTLWNSPNAGATNSSGFTALPAGYRNSDGSFSLLGGYGLWWSATAYDETYAFYPSLSCLNDDVNGGGGVMTPGFSVRCIKD
ncbi:hypothetical protein G4D82_08255 [Flavobacterium sp. CYK-4]|uniref:fibrobacter succinogenes major paralogous domain-containing protein n=1 Tax=Flavobacterium lotistagni TaxID=2709660 RepID=UPI00140DE3C7|nr:fibrobacter succinogenes major paralogous domain-containing protein [Flavobacterium lotistagni]NHM07212.1 hypothetical protein [Flavobacterium lotistagni]